MLLTEKANLIWGCNASWVAVTTARRGVEILSNLLYKPAACFGHVVHASAWNRQELCSWVELVYFARPSPYRYHILATDVQNPCYLKQR